MPAVTRAVITEYIRRLVAETPLNRLTGIDDGPIFDEPLVGVADGRDPLFAEYKQVIGDYYLPPVEALQKAADAEHALLSGAASVVCWVLPFAARIRAANAARNTLPASPLWWRGHELGEKLNDNLREQVVRFFEERGHVALAPWLSQFKVRIGRYATNWSERHALYAAGMGTFGLSRWFITERGVAMRCGSVITDAAMEPTGRRYTSRVQNCLHYTARGCTACIERCPAGAISEAGLDKPRCREYLDMHAKVEGCGLCHTAVPCESGIPVQWA